MERIIFHIDVNNAFLSWSAVDLLKNGAKVDIREICAVIGGDEKTRNGIVLAKSMPAKKLGVVTAETLYSARKKCKKLEVFPPNFTLYQEMSNKLFKLLSEYSPDIEVASIDECYLDYGKVKNLYGDEKEFAYMIKDRVKSELGFTVNIGIANNKLCAKMASDFSKPDKVHTLYQYEIKEKMWPLPVGELFGIGKQTVPKLQAIGIEKIADLANYDLFRLTRYFKNQASRMNQIANGIDYGIVDSSTYIPKGIGHEFTLTTDVNSKERLYQELFLLSEMVGKRLRKQKQYANVICVILKDNFFKRKSHQKKLKNATNITSEIYNISKDILNEFYDGEAVRLIGIRLDDLTDYSPYQTSLFDDIEKRDKEQKIDKVIDEINKKLGKSAIKKASLVKKDVKEKENYK
jgi:DNA polymerase-4